MTARNVHGDPDPSINVEHRIRRDTSEMLGLAKGILFDGVVTEEEAMGLMNWADERPDFAMAWPGNVIYRRLRKIFDDGHASDEEREDLRALLEELVGEGGTVGGETATTGLPLDDPVPIIELPDRVFAFTGRFAYGTRKACEEAVRRNGGWVEPRVTKRTDFLVIGTFASRDWLHTNYGRKIEKAVAYRDADGFLRIVSEEHWAGHL